MDINLQSTVAAISTPYGRGGVALIRISGDRAFQIADRVFVTASGVLPSSLEANRMVYGDVLLSGEKIDDGMIVLFKGPRSYTGEDTVEITCHGGILVSGKVLQAVLEGGAVMAAPGEFTKRAFMNGKLSLSQAEAVINVIDAETNASLRLALSHASGALTKKLDGIYSRLLSLVSQSYVYADYPDEDLTDINADEMITALEQVYSELCLLYSTYDTGRAINEGVYTAIVGRPNAGKSSLLNLLAGKERAIVSDVEGTTRDFIEESVTLGDIILRLCDTAGIRESDDKVERIGIERSLEAIERADLVLAVFDGSQKAHEEDHALIEKLKNTKALKIAVINKTELVQKFDTDTSSFDATIRISTVTGEGLDALREQISSFFIKGDIDYNESTLLVNARQFAAVKGASDALKRGIDALRQGYTQDVAGLDIEQAMALLGETDARQIGIDIVDSIFHNFCVGK